MSMWLFGVKSNFVSNAPARAFRTVDGTNWTTLSLPTTGEIYADSRGASRWNGQYVLFSGSVAKGWTSGDGVDWTLQTGKTWSGRGRQPAWLGKNPNKFLIAEEA